MRRTMARIADALVDRIAPNTSAGAVIGWWEFCYCVDTVRYDRYCRNVDARTLCNGCVVNTTRVCRKGEPV
ncbi:hypothetical protein [Pseudonocardia sp. TRM90224]|uniref:hypothetical protein n=1 Tax=Pseudonocardia sp. TRM90224 TaxID=2812678 RepID=UPI001E4E5987|nr:hypothetical protein [Pseudonocardia sp. TRM90224]